MPKLSTYQKNKKRIKELEHKIKMIVLYPETEEGQQIYFELLNSYEQREKNKG